ncbi:AAA family ATPase [Leucobacter allii]|uniref:MobF family relaxase n=1 Tax=Leucobacter allii TaxID=2932247 RepID=UPI001FD27553|nr:MobF family relaxase [Leucobacter allii]UOR00403.1 AAA family ATPase [Leucobacter allii]
MKGGVILFRGTGAAARRYLESDRLTADEYYLEGGTALAEFTVTDSAGEIVETRSLDPEQYAAWVDWIDPTTSSSMGTPRNAGEGMRGSPRYAEMVVNAPKSLSIAAALHPEVSDALDVAQRDAAAEIRRWLAQHSVTRVGPRHAREVVPVQRLQTVAIVHKTSRAGDPHRHIHFQIGARVFAAGKWRGLDTAALFKQQGAIRALGTAVIAAHPQLAAVLDRHGLTLDPVTGEVAELESFNAIMSKRGAQVERNLATLEAEWEAAHPGEEAGSVVRARLLHKAWEYERPGKKPTVLGSEAGWRAELEDAGYSPDAPREHRPAHIALDVLRIEEVASRALDRAAAGASAWMVHTLREHVTRLTTEYSVQATPEELREFLQLATQLAVSDCLSVLPPGAPTPEHVAHLTSLRVVAAEKKLRDLLTVRAEKANQHIPEVHELAVQAGLDADQERAAAVIASANPLVVVEGAAGAGKTTMLKTAIAAVAAKGREMRVVTPTKKAADVAAQELGIATDSVAALVYAHGFRWNRDGAWTRLKLGDTDPETRDTYRGPAQKARLSRGERIVVDEAGMLDQDSALALLRIADECGATIALVGDRAQLPAVGRGGVLDIAAQLAPAVADMTSLHRFADPTYAELTLDLRHARNPATIFERLHERGLIVLHGTDGDVQAEIATTTSPANAITTATNDEAQVLNERIRAERVHRGEVDDQRTVFGSDGLSIGVGDVIQTRRNEPTLGVANRQTWTVQHVGDDGTLSVVETVNGRKQQRTVTLPAEYVTENAHPAYAVTAYGVQGATVNASHTVLTDALDAAGIYVGMTRGREMNTLHIVATDLDNAKQQFVDALVRDRADRGLGDATERASAEIVGIVANGPVSIVNAERDRIVERITRVDSERKHWVSALEKLRVQSVRHKLEYAPQHEKVETAEANLTAVLIGVIESLSEEAAVDGAAFLSAQREAFTANRVKDNAPRFRKRLVTRAANDADARHAAAERALSDRWQSIPNSESGLHGWIEAVATRVASQTLKVIEARAEAAKAHQVAGEIALGQMNERQALRRRVLRNHRASEVATRVEALREQAKDHRNYIAQLDALPPDQAVELIHVRAAQEAQRLAAEEARMTVEVSANRIDMTGHERGRGRLPRTDGRSL